MKKFATVLFLAVGLFMLSTSVYAHHGNAGYDYEKTLTLKGTVTEWVWANPHCFLKVDVKDDKGNVQHWSLEAGSAGFNANNSGWQRNTFKAGDEVSVDIMPAKGGATVGRIRQVTLPNGKTLREGEVRYTL